MAPQSSAQIDVNDNIVTMINIYEVDPDKQEDLMRLLAEGTEKSMRHLPGFISVNIHRSFDGKRVANYAQWASKEAFDNMLRNPEAQAQMKQFGAIAKSVSPALYQVASVHAGE
ncbi:MAG: antibiotic biosynthesis monooxygenase [Telmatospirillum sp.]|nr:antibiotic biosynthesis monooxygenase [Telmatospirillum sp.]